MAPCAACRRLGQARSELQHVECAPAIAVGSCRDELQRRGLGRDAPRCRALCPRSASAARSNASMSATVERPQHVHPRPRKQRAHHLEGRILRRRADEGQRSVFQVRQKGVLLRLVESVNLVEEEQRRLRARGTRRARGLHRGTDILDPGHHGRELDELRVGAPGDEPRQRRLAGAGRSPEDQGVQLPGLDGAAQRLARTEHVLLADDFLQRSRPHPIGERPRRIGRARIGRAHLAGVPITSAPEGGVKVSSRGRHGDIDLDILEDDCDGLAELVLENHPLQRALGGRSRRARS